MVIEQERTLEGIQIAVQMEIDGKEFYLKASEESGNELGKKLLRALAAEEDKHRQKFVQIYEAIRNREAWPMIIPQSDAGKKLRTVFTRATEKLSSNVAVLATELDAIEKAKVMENRTYDFYTSRGQKAKYEIERDFYQSLATEERGHYLVLLDYGEFLENPAGWFVRKEHPSLDGG